MKDTSLPTLKVYPAAPSADASDGEPAPVPKADRPSGRRQRWKRQVTVFNFIFLVLPIAFGAAYLWIFATDTYVVDAVLAIRNASAVSATPMNVPMALGGGSTTAERAIDESYAIVKYVQSREAYDELNKRIDLDARFRNRSIGWLDRLSAGADENDRYNYYLNKTKIYYDDVEGQVNLSTYGYSAETSYRMAKELADMSERLVNRFNERAYSDMIKLAQEQVSLAEKDLRDTGVAINDFQFKNSMLDPTQESVQFNSIIANLRQQIAMKKAEISAASTVWQSATPYMASLTSQLDGLEGQLVQEQAKLTGQNAALAPLISTYKMLSISQQLAQQKYAGAISMLQSAVLQAERQRLYVVNIVPVREPSIATLPNKPKFMLLLALATFAVWVIARMIFAAIRDHRV